MGLTKDTELLLDILKSQLKRYPASSVMILGTDIDDSINEMFDELSSYKVSNIEYIPFTLEKYYEESIFGGNIDE